MEKFFISIIIPVFNGDQFIQETLTSLRIQTFKNFECIIIDDNSTDNTISILQEFAARDNRFKFYMRPENRIKGANTCRNIGFEKSNFNYVMFMDSDDLLTPTALENRVENIVNTNADAVIFSTSEFYKTIADSKKISNRDIEDATQYNYLQSFLSAKFNWTIMSVLWKRSSLITPLFDESLYRFQDVDFHLNQLMVGSFNFKRVYQVDNYYRIPDKPKSIDPAFRSKTIFSFIKIFEKIIPKISQDENLIRCFKRFIYVVYLRYVLPNKVYDKNLYNKFMSVVIQHQIFSNKERLLFQLQKFIRLNKLTSYKGLGGYRMEQHIKKHFNY